MLAATAAAVALFIVVGTITYVEMTTAKVTVDVQLKKGEDPFQTIKAILPPDAHVLNVAEVSRTNNEYKITVSTRRERARLLNWMRSNKCVEKVEEVPN